MLRSGSPTPTPTSTQSFPKLLIQSADTFRSIHKDLGNGEETGTWRNQTVLSNRVHRWNNDTMSFLSRIKIAVQCNQNIFQGHALENVG
jgi:hypothetical protein